MLQNSVQVFLNLFCFQILQGIKASKNAKEGVVGVRARVCSVHFYPFHGIQCLMFMRSFQS